MAAFLRHFLPSFGLLDSGLFLRCHDPAKAVGELQADIQLTLVVSAP